MTRSAFRVLLVAGIPLALVVLISTGKPSATDHPAAHRASPTTLPAHVDASLLDRITSEPSSTTTSTPTGAQSITSPTISPALPAPHTPTTTAPPAPPTTSTVPVPTTPPVGDSDGVTTAERSGWSKVAVCEEGGWVGSSGPAYPDSLGISATNWYGHGGTATVSEDAQILVAMRIQMTPPDQDGCAAW